MQLIEAAVAPDPTVSKAARRKRARRCHRGKTDRSGESAPIHGKQFPHAGGYAATRTVITRGESDASYAHRLRGADGRLKGGVSSGSIGRAMCCQ